MKNNINSKFRLCEYGSIIDEGRNRLYRVDLHRYLKLSLALAQQKILGNRIYSCATYYYDITIFYDNWKVSSFVSRQ